MTGYLKERSPGRWRIGVYLGRDVDGRRLYSWKTVRGKKSAAQRILNEMLADAQRDKLAPASKHTVESFLEKWLTDYAKPKTAPSTFRRYEQIVKSNLIPAFGRYRLAQLKPTIVQAAYSRWLENGRRPRPKTEKQSKISPPGLSAQSVLHFHRLLHSAFKTAVRWQLLTANPIDAVTPPRVAARTRSVPTELETRKFIRGLKDKRLAVPVVLAALAGLRRGEILGLGWADVDLKRGTLTVRRSLEQVRKQPDRLKEPKTSRSRRTIPLPELALATLRELQSDQALWRKFVGPGYVDSDRVCVHETGRPWTLDGLTCSYRKAAADASFPWRFHDLRHAHATWLLRAGIHPRIVAERLGHSSTSLTMDTYSHVLPTMQETAVASLDAVFSKKNRHRD